MTRITIIGTAVLFFLGVTIAPALGQQDQQDEKIHGVGCRVGTPDNRPAERAVAGGQFKPGIGWSGAVAIV
jgi:hypothetical protein